MSRILRIGSRRSALAKLQSYHVAQALRKQFADLEIEFVFKESMGDKDLTTPLWQMGDRGVFTKDFVEDLLNESVDVVIHSWKDLDLKESDGTEIISVLPRADQRDLLLLKKSAFLHPDFNVLKIHSSSPRREYNLKRFLARALPKRLQKEIAFEPVRGNISTRIRKWMESDLHGIIVAKAAFDRLLTDDFPEAALPEYAEIRNDLRSVLHESLFMILPLSENPNAPAQGALAAEVKKGRDDIAAIIRAISDPAVDRTVGHERLILKRYGGGCHQKIGVACVERPYGTATWLKGLTDDGIVLDERELVSGDRHPKALSPDKIWPAKKSAFDFSRTPVNAELPAAKDIWVARSSAWQDGWTQSDLTRVIWAAGLKTMYDLAAADVWVSGTSDALGEKEPTMLEILLGRNTDFVKVTHSLSGEIQSDIDRIYTYKLELNGEIPDLTGMTHFFWMSGHQFDLALEKYPVIAEGYHSSGPGITRDHILKRLGKKARTDVFINFEDWRKYHTK